MILSLLTKCKNLHISFNFCCVILSPNPGVEITLLVVKYDLRRFLDNAHKHKEDQYKINFLLSQVSMPWHANWLIIYDRVRAAPCIYLFLWQSCQIVLYWKIIKNIHNFCNIFCSTLRSSTAHEIFLLSLIGLHILPNETLSRTAVFITPVNYHAIKKSTLVKFVFCVKFWIWQTLFSFTYK